MTHLPGLENEIPYNNEYMSKSEILAILERYQKFVNPVYVENTVIQEIVLEGSVYKVYTNKGDYCCDHIIVASGMYSEPFIPKVSEKIPAEINQMHSSDYKNPCQMTPGNVVVVGSGWSGVQIALELKKALQNEVYLSIGSLSPLPVVYKNVHGVYWLNRLSGYANVNPILNYKKEDFTNPNILHKMGQNMVECQKNGVHLVGRLLDREGNKLIFNDNIRSVFKEAEKYIDTAKQKIDALIEKEHITTGGNEFDLRLDRVDLDAITPLAELDIHAHHITNIIWSTGFRRNYSYIKRPIFDENGLPLLIDGVATTENITFCGLELEVDRNIRSAFGVGLYAINESSKRAVDYIKL